MKSPSNKSDTLSDADEIIDYTAGVHYFMKNHNLRGGLEYRWGDSADAVLAGIVDPEAVEQCVNAGAGAEVELSVGGKIDYVFSKPLSISGTVLRLSKGEPNSEKLDAVLQVEGVTLVLLSGHRAFTDPIHFQAVEIDPLAFKIVVVKEGYLFQALRDIAPKAIMALTPGFANQILENLEYIHVRRPIFPLDPNISWIAK